MSEEGGGEGGVVDERREKGHFVLGHVQSNPHIVSFCGGASKH